jgi:hypothetical protein
MRQAPFVANDFGDLATDRIDCEKTSARTLARACAV